MIQSDDIEFVKCDNKKEINDEKEDNYKNNRILTFFDPLNRNEIYSYYIPLSGTFSYYAFALHISLPGGLVRLTPYYHLPIVNSLLFNSHIGVGCYLFTRPHIRLMSTYHRVMYSVFGSLIFNFGSILLWATTKRILPDNIWIRMIFSMISSYGYLTIGKEYIQTIDSLV